MNKESQAHYNKYKRNKESQQLYQSAAWRKARELALKRDAYLCVPCLLNKKIKRAEVVHHIIEVKDDMSLALTLDNLQSICHSCHNKHHKSAESNRKETLPTKVHVIKAERNPDIF